MVTVSTRGIGGPGGTDVYTDEYPAPSCTYMKALQTYVDTNEERKSNS
jgi:hypothetical protein